MTNSSSDATSCQTFVRQANESGLYDVDSPWPTECGKSRRRSRKIQQDQKTARESIVTQNNEARAANERLTQSRELAIYGADLNHRRLPV
ncbi:hypothetical protein T01_7101 [Trichinella spiralis]|uniref:Uncharacterized protein n=1 Tax=Trichinella spiralis TaxID=6334 RepID=A0A0V1AP89_TRISP|nr:hypothetical protein T01_5181 [Trichinella spiralis]KRY26651.1 hypothetical protein T01_16216 [Trichinella spiralis]KRY30368.1 hypothetical protein T01_7101 [Trichinella spiralis]